MDLINQTCQTRQNETTLTPSKIRAKYINSINFSEMKPCLPNSLEFLKDNQNISNKEIFDNKHKCNDSLDNNHYGDILYIIGKIWIEVLKSGLIGTKINVIPVVEAANSQETPKKPPKMKYKDLPLYECPHYEYKEHMEKKEKCPDANVKLVHESLLPHIKYYRKKAAKTFCDIKCSVKTKASETCTAIKRTKQQIKDTMRDPENLALRQAVVAAGGVTGYLLGRGGGISRRLFLTTAGLMATGALCFPKETDDVFREFSYYTGKFVVAVYNAWCDKRLVFRERLACRDDLPPDPPERKEICPKNNGKPTNNNKNNNHKSSNKNNKTVQ